MPMIDDVKTVIDSLVASDDGWGEIFHAHGMNIGALDLEDELERDLGSSITRKFKGFRDFAGEGRQAITPGEPARSLLYHALASAGVQWSDARGTKRLRHFPTIEQIAIVENYVYAARKSSVHQLQNIHGRGNLAVVVFASQYRTADNVPHKKHADLVFSRTGVSRVGNADVEYNSQTRSFSPFCDNPHEIRVLPARFDAYIAVRRRGTQALLGEGFNPDLQVPFTNVPPDEDLDFWHPVHKLFDGGECLDGLTVSATYRAHHTNEKIRKIHKYISGEFDIETGSTATEHADYPYKFSGGLADLQSNGLLVPTVHAALVAKAEVAGTKVVLKKDFQVPKEDGGNNIGLLSSSIEYRAALGRNPISRVSTGAQRSVPEYSHIRTKVEGRAETNLNEEHDLIATLKEASFDALHYVDFTGDGVVSVEFDAPTLSGILSVAAYSIIAPPDFFPFCTQASLVHSDVPMAVWSRPPQALSDVRLVPNIKSHPALIFDGMQVFDTCTALVSGVIDDGLTQTEVEVEAQKRVSYLPDGAAGVFAPGWDTSFDMVANGQENIPMLAAYGLGSPFPEDAKLCAAISSFWPAAAPDSARSFWPEAATHRTVIPLTDEEVGSTGERPGWDGEHGPRLVNEAGRTLVLYKKFDRVDYTLNALNNDFDYSKFKNIDSEGYVDRVKRYQLASRRVGGGTAILIGYNIDANGDHHYHFMQEFKHDHETRDTVTLEVLRSTNIRVDAAGRVTTV